MRLWESGTWPSKTPTGSHGNSTWRRMNPLHLAVLLAVSSQSPSMQDADARVLLQLEDDWAGALIRRDATVFRRLLADGFIYTEDDRMVGRDRKSTRLNSSHLVISYAVFCLKKKKQTKYTRQLL